ncbi:UbiA family prenyltransferase [Nocardia sp. CA-129566]|uniref:UbiA family prenyltransferase n=1 Tax=Nocardia sp. CA-129566 TaxID=3239976 RepID=UPI003D970A12
MLDFFRLGRLRLVAFAAIPFLLGVLAVPSADLVIAGRLVLYGVVLHLFACHVNDFADLEYDRANPVRRESPLVTGTVAPSRVLLWILTEAIVLSATIWTSPIPLWVRVGLFSMLFVAGYGNIFQKRSSWISPLVMDYIFGFGSAVHLMFTAGALGAVIRPVLVVVVVINGFVLVMVNSYGGNLKDLEHDRGAGLRTTAIVSGVVTCGGRLVFTATYVAFLTVAQAGVVTGALIVTILRPGVFTCAASILALGSTAGLVRQLRDPNWGAEPASDPAHPLAALGRPWWIFADLVVVLAAATAFAAPRSVLAVACAVTAWSGFAAAASAARKLHRRRTTSARRSRRPHTAGAVSSRRAAEVPRQMPDHGSPPSAAVRPVRPRPGDG